MFPTAQANGAFPPGSYDGMLSFRWTGNLTGTALPYYKNDVNSGDLVPTAMYWPNGTLATETNVIDLLVDNDLITATPGLIANTGTVTTPPTGPTDSTLTDAFKNWQPNALAGYVVHIYAGSGRGQVRTIQSNTAQQLTINPVTGQPAYWTTGNLPDTTSQYRIERPDNNLPSKFQPNNLQGDDRLYLSLGSLRDSVVVPALSNSFPVYQGTCTGGGSATTLVDNTPGRPNAS